MTRPARRTAARKTIEDATEVVTVVAPLRYFEVFREDRPSQGVSFVRLEAIPDDCMAPIDANRRENADINHDLSECRFAMFFQRAWDVGNTGRALILADWIITYMRLLKAGDVYSPLMIARGSVTHEISEMRYYRLRGYEGRKFVLRESDVRVLERLLDAPDHLTNDNWLAFNRFRATYRDTWNAEKLVNCWIGLESLFIKSDRDELRFRAALRIAHYLAKSPDERSEIYERVKRSYDTRSRIVHGSLPDEDLVARVSEDTQDILRRALRQLLLGGVDIVPERIDQSIVRGGPLNLRNPNDPTF